MIDKELGGSVVEPWIKFVDDGLISDGTEDSNNGRDGADEEKDSDPNGRFPSM